MQLLAPRQAYLPIFVKQLKHYFEHVLPPGEDQPWFELRGLPLKWDICVGVLYDLLASEETPWTITVHFRDFPAGIVPFLCSTLLTKFSHVGYTFRLAYALR
mgnify:CR=1 FL=1